MASERIGDERLDAILAIALWARDNDMVVELPHEDAESMAAELRSLRTSAIPTLTEEEREALRWLRLQFRALVNSKSDAEVVRGWHDRGYRALSVLDKLLASGGGGR